MQLGTQTNSLVNHIYGSADQTAIKPEVGMGATILSWTDRHAATVIAIEGNIITIQTDTATRTDKNGMSDNQDYDYAANPNGQKTSYRLNKAGRYEQVYKKPETGRWVKTGGTGTIRLGKRNEYRDFSF